MKNCLRMGDTAMKKIAHKVTTFIKLLRDWRRLASEEERKFDLMENKEEGNYHVLSQGCVAILVFA